MGEAGKLEYEDKLGSMLNVGLPNERLHAKLSLLVLNVSVWYEMEAEI